MIDYYIFDMHKLRELSVASHSKIFKDNKLIENEIWNIHYPEKKR